MLDAHVEKEYFGIVRDLAKLLEDEETFRLS